MDESDDFFTATDDEMSCFDKNANLWFTAPTNAAVAPLNRENMIPDPVNPPLLLHDPVNNPVLKRKIMKDKSFDFSTSSGLRHSFLSLFKYINHPPTTVGVKS